MIAKGSDFQDPARSDLWGGGLSLADRIAIAMIRVADSVDFPERVKMLWDAGANLHTSRLPNHFGSALDILMSYAIIYMFNRTRLEKHRIEQQYIPRPPSMSTRHVIEYDRLEDASAMKYRPRTSKSLWHTWYPGDELPRLEAAQRHLDARMEVPLEAGS